MKKGFLKQDLFSLSIPSRETTFSNPKGGGHTFTMKAST